MIIELDKTDIINMILGTYPTYEQMDKFERLGLGYYIGGFDDKWVWNSYSNAWKRYTEEQLFEFYKELKK